MASALAADVAGDRWLASIHPRSACQLLDAAGELVRTGRFPPTAFSALFSVVVLKTVPASRFKAAKAFAGCSLRAGPEVIVKPALAAKDVVRGVGADHGWYRAFADNAAEGIIAYFGGVKPDAAKLRRHHKASQWPMTLASLY